ncbi:MAG TPA: biotin/lipoyl-containing protein, partial [Acidisarcina sp.]
MPTDVIMPQMGESIFEGTITKWLKKLGDTIERDEPLFEISTDKVDAEIPSPTGGVLTEIKVAEGATVQINTVVAVIGEASSAVTAAPAAKEAPATKAVEKSVAQGDGSPGGNGAPAAPPAAAADHAPASPPAAVGIDVIMPQMGESIFEGTITKWLKQVGDHVQRDEPLFEISTDKVDAEIPSPEAGVLSEIKVEAGSTVQINTVVAVIGGSASPTAAGQSAAGQTAADPSPVGETEVDTVKPTPVAAKAGEAKAVAEQVESLPDIGTGSGTGSGSEGGRVRSSPLVRRIAKDNNLDLTKVKGTGSAGRVTKENVLQFMAEGGAGSAAPAAPVPAAKSAPAPAPVAATPVAGKTSAPAPAATPQPGELVPMTRMRSIIAQRMVESK